MFDYKIDSLAIAGTFAVVPSAHVDLRGEIWSGASPALAKELGLPNFWHHKTTLNKKNTLRGIHGDLQTWKLVCCLGGKVQQVCVDNRPDSPTYLHHISIILDVENKLNVLVPPGVGNAFKALEEDTVYSYSLAYEGVYQDFDSQFTLYYDDPRLKIDWQGGNPVLSERDRKK